MKIIDNRDNFEKFLHLPEGNVFRYNNQYFIKTRTMFLYDDIDDFLYDENLECVEQVELAGYDTINAINLNDANHCHFKQDELVEPLKTELHLV